MWWISNFSTLHIYDHSYSAYMRLGHTTQDVADAMQAPHAHGLGLHGGLSNTAGNLGGSYSTHTQCPGRDRLITAGEMSGCGSHVVPASQV